MVSLQSHASLSLRHNVTGTDTVTWSVDNRIAITSQDIVYVFSLNRPLEPTVTTLPATISIANIPKLPKLSNSGLSRSLLYCLDIDRSIFLDPAMGNVELLSDIFTSTEWSPSGCGPNGRCLLTCLTKCSNLYIYTPPSSQGNNWKMTFSVSKLYKALLEKVGYNIKEITQVDTTDPNTDPSTSVPSTSNPSTSVPSTIDPSTSVLSTSGPLTIDPSTSDPSTSNIPLTNTSIHIQKTAYLKEAQDLLHQRMLLCITAFSWLPVTMVTPSGKERWMLLSVTVRAGYLLLFSFSFNRNGAGNLYLLNVIKLFSNDSLCSNHWPCMLKFISHNQVHILNIGYTNGKMECLYWNQIETNLMPEYFKMPRPLITLWPLADDIPVNLVTWSNNLNTNDQWCVFVKSNRTVAILVEDLPTSPQVSHDHVLFNGFHNISITGLSLLHNSFIITCSQDGVVQTTPIPERSLLINNSHVTKERCHVMNNAVVLPLTPFKHCHSFHGLALSDNGLYLAVTVSFSSLNKLDSPSTFQLYSVQIHSDNYQPTCNISWDLYEYSRLNYPSLDTLEERDLKQQCYIQQLMSANDSSDFINVNTDTTIMVQYSLSVLNRYLTYVNETNQQNPMESKISRICRTSLSNFCSLLAVHANDDDICNKLVERVQESVSGILESTEHCGICNAMIPYSCYHGDGCSNGHYWKRCILTQCLITTPYKGCCCSLCNSHAYSISCVQSDTWLSWLLQNVYRCPLCDGYFDSFISNYYSD